MKKFKDIREAYQNKPPEHPSFDPRYDRPGKWAHLANTANTVSESFVLEEKHVRLWDLGRMVSHHIGQGSLRPTQKEMKAAATSLNISVGLAHRALAAFNDPNGATRESKQHVKISESAMSQVKQFMKSNSNNVKHAAAFHVRSKGKSLETNKVSANTVAEMGYFFGGHTNQVQTNPTRMQVQDYFNTTKGSQRARIYKTEQAMGVYDIRLNSHNEIIYFMVSPKHHYTDVAPSTYYGEPREVPLHENYEANKFHKVLTQHGWKYEKTTPGSLGSGSNYHYSHPKHGKSSVTVLDYHDGTHSWVHHHEQSNGIVGPYGHGETKPGLHKHLSKMYNTGLKEQLHALIIKELFDKNKIKNDDKSVKKDMKPPRDDPDDKAPKGDKDDNDSDTTSSPKIDLSGRKEPFCDDPVIEPINHLNVIGI